MSANVTVKSERSALDALMRDLGQLTRASATVGYHDPTPVKPSVNPFSKDKTPRPSGLTVPELAAIQEYGTAGIPSRPYMRRALQSADELVNRVASEQFAAVVNGDASPTRAMAEVGDAVAGRVLDTLEDAASWAKPNSPITIANKPAGAPPLLAYHGQLRSELTYAVYDGDRQLLLEKPQS